jgi:hypothetical protein
MPCLPWTKPLLLGVRDPLLPRLESLRRGAAAMRRKRRVLSLAFPTIRHTDAGAVVRKGSLLQRQLRLFIHLVAPLGVLRHTTHRHNTWLAAP